jgi:hypothetical protein
MSRTVIGGSQGSPSMLRERRVKIAYVDPQMVVESFNWWSRPEGTVMKVSSESVSKVYAMRERERHFTKGP